MNKRMPKSERFVVCMMVAMVLPCLIYTAQVAGLLPVLGCLGYIGIFGAVGYWWAHRP